MSELTVSKDFGCQNWDSKDISCKLFLFRMRSNHLFLFSKCWILFLAQSSVEIGQPWDAIPHAALAGHDPSGRRFSSAYSGTTSCHRPGLRGWPFIRSLQSNSRAGESAAHASEKNFLESHPDRGAARGGWMGSSVGCWFRDCWSSSLAKSCAFGRWTDLACTVVTAFPRHWTWTSTVTWVRRGGHLGRRSGSACYASSFRSKFEAIVGRGYAESASENIQVWLVWKTRCLEASYFQKWPQSRSGCFDVCSMVEIWHRRQTPLLVFTQCGCWRSESVASLLAEWVFQFESQTEERWTIGMTTLVKKTEFECFRNKFKVFPRFACTSQKSSKKLMDKSEDLFVYTWIIGMFLLAVWCLLTPITYMNTFDIYIYLYLDINTCEYTSRYKYMWIYIYIQIIYFFILVDISWSIYLIRVSSNGEGLSQGPQYWQFGMARG